MSESSLGLAHAPRLASAESQHSPATLARYANPTMRAALGRLWTTGVASPQVLVYLNQTLHSPARVREVLAQARANAAGERSHLAGANAAGKGAVAGSTKQTVPATPAPTASSQARHDYDAAASCSLGEGDQVVTPGAAAVTPETITAAFSATPSGVVEAALYELHRGESRSFADIVNDPTSARFERGPAAPIEGAAHNNDDAAVPTVTSAERAEGLGVRGTVATEQRLAALQNSLTPEEQQQLARLRVLSNIGESRRNHRGREIGRNPSQEAEYRRLLRIQRVMAIFSATRQRSSQRVARVRGHDLGTIGVASRLGRMHGGESSPWCGAFAAYLYARAGITVPRGSFNAARNVAETLLALPGAQVYERANVGNATGGQAMENVPRPTSTRLYYASYNLSVRNSSGPSTPALHLDIRPGDVAWTMHNIMQGHVMMVVAVNRDANGADVVTVEGNAGQRVQAHHYRIDYVGGRITSEIVGWGRPPELASAPAPSPRVDSAVTEFAAAETAAEAAAAAREGTR